jgi:hypothetical protein
MKAWGCEYFADLTPRAKLVWVFLLDVGLSDAAPITVSGSNLIRLLTSENDVYAALMELRQNSLLKVKKVDADYAVIATIDLMPEIKIPLSDGTEYLVTREDLDMYARDYPLSNVVAILRGAARWGHANPKKRKTRARIHSHLECFFRDEPKADRSSNKPVSARPVKQSLPNQVEGKVVALTEASDCDEGEQTDLFIDTSALACRQPLKVETPVYDAQVRERGLQGLNQLRQSMGTN